MTSLVESNGALIRSFAVICAAVGLECLRSSLTGGIPMPPETHGGAMYAIPGELWSLVSMGQGVALYWFTKPVRLWPLAIAALVGGVTNMAIAFFSAGADFGFIQSRVAWGVGLLHLTICGFAFIETRQYAALRRAVVGRNGV